MIRKKKKSLFERWEGRWVMAAGVAFSSFVCYDVIIWGGGDFV